MSHYPHEAVLVVASIAVDAALSGATKLATTVIVTTPLTKAMQNVTVTVPGTTTTPALVSDAQKVTAIIESLHATHQSAEKTGDNCHPYWQIWLIIWCGASTLKPRSMLYTGYPAP